MKKKARTWANWKNYIDYRFFFCNPLSPNFASSLWITLKDKYIPNLDKSCRNWSDSKLLVQINENWDIIAKDPNISLTIL